MFQLWRVYVMSLSRLFLPWIRVGADVFRSLIFFTLLTICNVLGRRRDIRNIHISSPHCSTRLVGHQAASCPKAGTPTW
ncbi:hypothetical protein BDV98DRAFT_557457 [Pterulicium gracile]|uniref:Uncharacterized protein n=1 Tax=Pterulicium gracile TaxID=1884261 RepID=A0A5C3R3B0_9AGAR|nr:hypothetical protein BDV98DRAFT_557457 [Pterula gracilis]